MLQWLPQMLFLLSFNPQTFAWGSFCFNLEKLPHNPLPTRGTSSLPTYGMQAVGKTLQHLSSNCKSLWRLVLAKQNHHLAQRKMETWMRILYHRPGIKPQHFGRKENKWVNKTCSLSQHRSSHPGTESKIFHLLVVQIYLFAALNPDPWLWPAVAQPRILPIASSDLPPLHNYKRGGTYCSLHTDPSVAEEQDF